MITNNKIGLTDGYRFYLFFKNTLIYVHDFVKLKCLLERVTRTVMLFVEIVTSDGNAKGAVMIFGNCLQCYHGCR